jgi:hypothetical protein
MALISFRSYSQMSVTSYSIYALGVNTSKDKMISGELKTFLNRDLDDITFELSGMYNFKASDYHRFSVGLGAVFTPFKSDSDDGFDAISVPVQLEIFPLQDFKRLAFVIEFSPHWVAETTPSFQYLWGIRYTFD